MEKRLTSHDIATVEVAARALVDAYRRRARTAVYATLREEAALYELRTVLEGLADRQLVGTP